MKDQGYGLLVKCLGWIEDGSRIASDGGMVISADKKIVEIWDRNSAHINFASMTPSIVRNHLHHIPGSGLIMLANERIQMNAYYIPQLGPAPKWCSFLDNITEDQTGRNWGWIIWWTLLRSNHTCTVTFYLKLYDTARVISNPYIHEEHREKTVKEKLEKLSETRIRTRKDAPKVNKILAEKIRREEEFKRCRRTNGVTTITPTTDERSKALFEDHEFEAEADTNTNEYKTAVDDEEDKCEKLSSNDDMNNSESKSGSEEDSESDDDSTNSSDASSLH
ncbi:hypothetical protein Clacol_004643 [Clathrus columnatus]|uniref:Uncharacterized protein n=1 Tax=Clathrus columnatus TaxID=1419009 RepID=A0AAV5A9N2_9AGAM|nr:hypothetical protein Clacol_004643 [Clathrus columnatus]